MLAENAQIGLESPKGSSMCAGELLWNQTAMSHCASGDGMTVMMTCFQEKTEKSGRPGWPSHRTRWRSWRRSSSRATIQTSTPGSSWRLTWASPRAAYRWETPRPNHQVKAALSLRQSDPFLFLHCCDTGVQKLGFVWLFKTHKNHSSLYLWNKESIIKSQDLTGFFNSPDLQYVKILTNLLLNLCWLIFIIDKCIGVCSVPFTVHLKVK